MPKRFHLKRPDLAREVAEALAGCKDVVAQQRLLAEFATLATQIPSAPGREMRTPPTSVEALRALAPDAWAVVAQALAGEAA